MINGIKWYILIAGKGNPQDRSKSHVIDGEGSLPKLPSANIHWFNTGSNPAVTWLYRCCQVYIYYAVC